MYVTAPERGAPWPGEVVLHYVGGMSEADQMFRGEKMKCLFAIMRDLKARQGPTYDHIEAVRTWLIEQKGFGQDWCDRLLHGRRNRDIAGIGSRV